MEPEPSKALQQTAKRRRLGPSPPSEDSKSQSEGGAAENPGAPGPLSLAAVKEQLAGTLENLSQENRQAVLMSLKAAFQSFGREMERLVREQSEWSLKLFQEYASQLLALADVMIAGQHVVRRERQECTRLLRLHQRCMAQSLRSQNRHVEELRRVCEAQLHTLGAAADGHLASMVARDLRRFLASLEEKVMNENEKQAAVLKSLVDDLGPEL